MAKKVEKIRRTLEEEASIQALSNELKDITKRKVGRWIYEYRPKESVGEDIYIDFLDYNRASSTSSKKAAAKLPIEEIKYIFSKDVQYEGVLSNTQAFQALSILINDFNVNKEGSKEALLALLNRILNSVVGQVEGAYVFDTTPYLHKSESFKINNAQYAYIDTVTWVISSALSFFRLYISGAISGDDVDEMLEKLIPIYKYGVKYLCDSYIRMPDSAKNCFKKGWNFTKDCSEPSLYFTFAVSEVMIDILTSFENVVRSADIELVCQGIDDKFKDLLDRETDEDQRNKLEEEIRNKKKQIEDTYKDNKEKLDDKNAAGVRERLLFERVNGCGVYGEGSLYMLLESLVKEAANNIWSIVKDDISDKFFSYNLESEIAKDTIEQSGANDALFNSVFLINIVINAGLDEDAEDMINYFTLNDSEEYLTAITNYDDIRESLRMAYDNTWQFYRRLKKNKKDYKVNDYTLLFDEKFKNKKIEEIAIELRKAHIHVFSLMPLLVKTKTTIGEFVIQYPQYDMQIYLEEILLNRYHSDTYGRDMWIWEKDHYSTSSNYYFISGLADFYKYYEDYEKDVIEDADKNEAREKALIKEREDNEQKFSAKNTEIDRLKSKIGELENQCKGLEEDRALYSADPLKYGLSLYIQQVIKEKFLEIFTGEAVGTLLSNISADLSNEAYARVSRKASTVDQSDVQSNWYDCQDPEAEEHTHTKALEDGMSAFIRAILSERLAEMLYSSEWKKEEPMPTQNQYEKRMNALMKDVQNAIRLYVNPISAGNRESIYVQTQAYDGIVSVLQKEKAKKDNND